jgi:hypothetical protein
MGKNQKDKNLFTTLKNTHTFKNVEFKTLKIQFTFQNWSRISKVQESFTTYNLHDMLLKIAKYYPQT